MMRSLNLFVAALSLVLASCNKIKEPTIGAWPQQVNETNSMNAREIDMVLQRLSLEISYLLKQSGIKYDKTYLNYTDNVSHYSTNYKKALNLGVYNVDFAFAGLFGKNQDGLEYTTVIKKLADDLFVGQFYETEAMKKMTITDTGMDSLLSITAQNFNNLNHFLQTQHRERLSILMLTGAWIEALHILCQQAKLDPHNGRLLDSICGQKLVLNNILLLLSLYRDTHPDIAMLERDLKALKHHFDNVVITHTQPSASNGVKDVVVVRKNSIHCQDIDSIRSAVNMVRARVVN